MTLVQCGFHDPRAAATGTFNAWGDHVGHTAALGSGNQATLAVIEPWHPSGRQIETGYGSRLLANFLDWAAAHGVMAIGGPPAGFRDSPIRPDSLGAMQAIYAAHHSRFLMLPNQAHYPRSDFFDTADHLNEAAQLRHSVLVAQALAEAINATTLMALGTGEHAGWH
jgi:hypothetical protein